MTAIDFRRQAPVLTLADMDRRYPPLPQGWTQADDVALWEGLFLGLKLGQISLPRGKSLDEMQARFLAFRHAATDGVGPLMLTEQERWLELARKRAGVDE